MRKGNKEIVKGTVAIGFSAILWGFDGVVLTPRLYGFNECISL